MSKGHLKISIPNFFNKVQSFPYMLSITVHILPQPYHDQTFIILKSFYNLLYYSNTTPFYNQTTILLQSYWHNTIIISES